ncbi:MAG TPA: alkaline phosphatase family protein, partial [Chitinophagaceae bacterium]|nr:alkaline phosphatase family protein [Chitinophagaceae bacterium]
MKNVINCIFLFSTFLVPFSSITLPPAEEENQPLPVAGNLFIITTDGFRWQELFTGADSTLLHDTGFTPDTATMKLLYWSNDPAERRKKLMPFFWSVLATRGQVYGNRHYENHVNIANPYALSYPGYNEIFSGHADLGISSNRKMANPHINVLEFLNEQPGLENRVVAFTSWDVFPYILNRKRNQLTLNSGYEPVEEIESEAQHLINQVQSEAVLDKSATRFDLLTFLAAKEYLKEKLPRVLYLGLGETDEFAHEGRYDLYLQQAQKVDQMIAELWLWVQNTPGYKDNTSFIITTDHGRGRAKKWTRHGEFIRGSTQTWLALLGPGIPALGEIKEKGQLYQQQLARLIAGLLGEGF